VAANAYRHDDRTVELYATRFGAAQLDRLLTQAEKDVAKRSEATRTMPVGVSPARARASWGRLTTACEVRDLYMTALRVARERSIP
jgi:hypothetical protein